MKGPEMPNRGMSGRFFVDSKPDPRWSAAADHPLDVSGRPLIRH